MKFGGVTVSFAEFWNVKIVVFAEYAVDDFVCAHMFVVFTAASKQLVDCCCSVRIFGVFSNVCECEMGTKGREL